MRATFVLAAVFLAGCADVETGERTVDLAFEDVDLRDAVDAVAREGGEPVKIHPDVRGRVSASFRHVPPTVALQVLALRTGCVFDGGRRHQFPHFFVPEGRRTAFDLGGLVCCIAWCSRECVIFAVDADAAAPADPSRIGTCIDGEAILGTALAPLGLYAARVGTITVLSHADLGPGLAPASRTLQGGFCSWHAPARGWFELLERLTGKRVDHGDAPIDVDLWDVSSEEIQLATAVASRAPSPRKPLEDLPPFVRLPSGRVIAIPLQAIFVGRHRSLALVDGRILEPGDRLLPGVSLGMIRHDALELIEGDERTSLRIR